MKVWARAVAWATAVTMGMCAAPVMAAATDAPLPGGALTPAAPIATPAVQPATPQLSVNERVIGFVDYGNQDDEEQCLATAVFYEARGETLEGQLAVAQVILNRTRSGRYPASICGVVTQPAQFSFVHGGHLPSVDRKNECWHKALAIADVALKKLAAALPGNILWYHADYVDPRWNREMTRAMQIGSHIFYSTPAPVELAQLGPVPALVN